MFLALQAKEKEDLIKFVLRSPVTIKLKEETDLVCPSSLKNFYTVSISCQIFALTTGSSFI